MRWMHDGDINRFTGDAPLITDDHPLTELKGGKSRSNSSRPDRRLPCRVLLLLFFLIRSLVALLRSRRDVALENLVLRHQLLLLDAGWTGDTSRGPVLLG
jgi:hypothetical protein